MIRNATINDAEAIAAIHVKTWQAAYAEIFPSHYLAGLSIEKRTDAWRQLLTDSQHTTLVASVDDFVVGWISGGVGRDDDAQGALEVHALYVLPAYWGKDVGAALMRGVEQVFGNEFAVTLWVLQDNARALRFYRKFGYVPDGKWVELERGGVKRTEIRLRKQPRVAKGAEPKPFSELIRIGID